RFSLQYEIDKVRCLSKTWDVETLLHDRGMQRSISKSAATATNGIIDIPVPVILKSQRGAKSRRTNGRISIDTLNRSSSCLCLSGCSRLDTCDPSSLNMSSGCRSSTGGREGLHCH